MFTVRGTNPPSLSVVPYILDMLIIRANHEFQIPGIKYKLQLTRFNIQFSRLDTETCDSANCSNS